MATNNSLNETETLEHLNLRYADALMPLTITFGVFTLLGILGNLLILVVFSLSKEYRNNNFKIFVLTLGIIDFVSCVTLIPAEMVKQRHYFEFGSAITCKVKCFFNVFVSSASCLALLVISIDRFRKVVQPLRKQLSTSMAIKVLFVSAFVFPIIIAVPGTIMCGIEKTNKTNLYGGITTINLCGTEDIYRKSIWRLIYKVVFILLLVGISIVYIILYTCVLREVAKQLKSIAMHRKNSSFEVSYSSDVCEPNTIYKDSNIPEHNRRQSSRAGEDVNLVSQNSFNTVNGSLSLKDVKRKKFSRTHSMKSTRTVGPLLHRAHFPSKTIIWFILTLVFIVTYITHLGLALKVGDVVFMTPSEFSTYSFFFRIYFFNHMINPLVYAIFVKRFRQSCRNIIPTIKKRLADWFT